MLQVTDYQNWNACLYVHVWIQFVLLLYGKFILSGFQNGFWVQLWT